MSEKIKRFANDQGQPTVRDATVDVKIELLARDVVPGLYTDIATGGDDKTQITIMLAANGIYVGLDHRHPDDPEGASFGVCHWRLDLSSLGSAVVDATREANEGQLTLSAAQVQGKRQALLDALTDDFLRSNAVLLRGALESGKAVMAADHALASLPEQFKNIISVCGVDNLDQLAAELADAMLGTGMLAPQEIKSQKERRIWNRHFNKMAEQLPDYVRGCVGGDHE